MFVPVMGIREVRMAVGHRLVPVRMAMLCAGRHWRIVRVVVMGIAVAVHVFVRMLDRFVAMHMFMALGQMQPDTGSHENRRDGELRRDGIAQQDDRKGRAEERCHGKISARARSAEFTQRDDEQHQASAIAREAE